MPKTEKKIHDYDQEYLESKILEYQSALVTNNKIQSNELYSKICQIYKPEKYVATWQRQYLYLYDSKEDFNQDYTKIFIQTLNKWRPREQRGESRYNGAGTFKNYFWGSLSHHYINMIKSVEGAAKRNITTRCPECGEWVNPIGTHIINHHCDLLWSKLEKDGMDIHKITSCPFCAGVIYRGKTNISENELVKRHIISKHSYMLFEIFTSKYPSVHSGSTKLVSSEFINEQQDEEFSIYDSTPAHSALLDKIMSLNLTPIQQIIVENIISKKTPCEAKWSKSLYKCSQAEFDHAMDGLRDKLMILEDSIGKY